MGDGGGQVILTRDQHDPTGPLVRRRITRTYQRTAYALQVLTLRDEDGNEQTLRVTEEHPFYVDAAGWTPAKSLESGDMLLGADGTLTVVANEHEAHPGGVTVYNLEVEQAHTYFVLAEDANDAAAVWVHNADYRRPLPAEFEQLAFGKIPTKKTFELPWSDRRNLTRIADDYSRRTRTLKEATLLRWSSLNLDDIYSIDFQRFQHKLAQASADGWLLANDRRVNRVIWYGVEALPTTGRASQLTRLLQDSGIEYRIVRPK